jgi:ribose 5-phosphate isomerase A
MANAREAQKRAAALAAVSWVKSGMRLGLGSGSTAAYATLCLGEMLGSGELEDIVAVPTSSATAVLARAHGIPLAELDETPLDLTIDGADEVTDTLEAIKGLGGALLREKLLAAHSRDYILVCDVSKRVTQLGERTPLPVEVACFGWRATREKLAALGCEPKLRRIGAGEGAPVFITDNGNYILDCHFHAPFSPQEVDANIDGIPGALEHGLFLGLAKRALVASDEGVLELS